MLLGSRLLVLALSLPPGATREGPAEPGELPGWQQVPEPAPAPGPSRHAEGRGLLVAGTTVLSVGAVGLTFGGVWSLLEALSDVGSVCETTDVGYDCREPQPRRAPVMLGVSLASVVVGTSLVIAGARVRVRVRGRERGSRARLAPSFGATTTSLSFGLVGRF